MRGFIVYPTYKMEDDKAYVYLFGRLENGESFLTIHYFKPYFFIKKSEVKKAEELEAGTFEVVTTHFKNFNNEPLAKIVLNLPKNVPKLRDAFESSGIKTYEADIRFAYRFMMDHQLKGVMEIEGGYEKGELVNRIYKEPKIKHGELYDVKLKVVSIDIETSMNTQEIYSISFYTDEFKKVFVVHKDTNSTHTKLNHALSFPDEKAMLEAFQKKVIELDPDIITGWNCIDFDMRVLKERFQHYKIPLRIGRIDWECKLRIESAFLRESSADVPGRQVLDGIHLLKNSFIKLEDYKLDTAAKAFLGKQKKFQFDKKEKFQAIDTLYKTDLQALVDYNLLDAELVYYILTEKHLIELTIRRSILTGMPLDRVSAAIASLDSLYLRETAKLGYACSTSVYTESEERIKGGFVMSSQPGIYEYITVLDFKSLYPSIIRTFNIDPLCFSPEGDIVAPNGAKFINKDGILPKLIQQLWEQRDVAKKKKDEYASFAIKITMNSLFGVLANPNCRFYSLDMANAITHFGQMIVKDAATEVTKMGYNVIYGDTDSIFIESKATSIEEAEEIGNKIQKYINEYFKTRVKKEYKRTSFLELEFDKVYKKFLMPKIRSQETGAKKRYAGLLLDDHHEKIEVVGMEAVRGDWTELAKKFQMELLNRMFQNKDVKEYIKTLVHDLKKGKYDELLVYKKSIRKELKEYTKTTPPHVKAARQLEGLDGNVIAYVQTVKGPEPIQKLKSAIDYGHYIEKQLKPIADSILVFQNLSFDDLVKGHAQKNLFEY